MLYFHSLLSKQHVKCGSPADRLDCSISTMMASQPCGGTIANTVRVFTASYAVTFTKCHTKQFLHEIFNRLARCVHLKKGITFDWMLKESNSSARL